MLSSPSGVAALPRPSIFAATFIVMTEIISSLSPADGNSLFIKGASVRLIIELKPDLSVISVIPHQNAIVGRSFSESSTAFTAPSITADESACIFPVSIAETNETATSATQT